MPFFGPDPYPECTVLPLAACLACCAASAAEEYERLVTEARAAFAAGNTHPLYPRLTTLKQFRAVISSMTFKRRIDCERRCEHNQPVEEPAPEPAPEPVAEPAPEPVYRPTPAERSIWDRIGDAFGRLVRGTVELIEDAFAAGKRFIEDHPVAAGTLLVVAGVVFVVVFAPGAAAAAAATLVEVGTEAAITASGLLAGGGGAVVYAGAHQ